MKKVLLIQTSEIIASSVIESNVDTKLLAKTLSIVQETSLKPILGDDLYEGLIDAVYDYSVSGVTLTTAYSDLLIQVKPYLIAKTVAEFILINNYKVTNKGLMKLNDNSATNLSDFDLQNVKDYYDNQISTYKATLVKYLKDTNLIDYTNDVQISSDSTGWFFGTSYPDYNNDIREEVASIDNYVAPTSGTYTYQDLTNLRMVLLIGTDEIIAQSVIENNVDTKLLSKTIQTVQETYLKEILTENVYYDLLQNVYDVEISGATLNDFYTDLLTLVKPYLINKTVAEFIIPNQYKFTNKGLMKLNDNSATALEESDLQSIKNHFDNISTSYKIDVVNFLVRYNVIECGSDKNITSDATGWYLGNETPHTAKSTTSSLNLSSRINTDYYTTGATLNNNIATFTRNDNNSYTLNLSGLSTNVDGLYVHISGDSMTGKLFTPALSASTIESGFNSLAIGNHSHAEGNETIASGDTSHAEGSYSLANGYSSHAEGVSTISTGVGSHAEGDSTTSTGDYSHSEGKFSVSVGGSSHAEGLSSVANGTYSHAEGEQTTANGIASHAEGYGTSADGDHSHAEGFETIASGDNSHAEGYGTIASGIYSHAEGQNTNVIGVGSHAEGLSTFANGDNSHAEGFNSNADGIFSHAEGNGTLASGYSSHAEGEETQATGDYTHAEGRYTQATGVGTHAEGGFTIAGGTYAHAEGYQTTTTGLYTHAEGVYTKANGSASHAEGGYTTSNGLWSHAEGFQTVADGQNQHVSGAYNVTGNTTDYFVIGGGDATLRKDLFNVGTGTTRINTDLIISGLTSNPLRITTLQSASDSQLLSIDTSGYVHTKAVSSFTDTNIYNSDGSLTGNRIVGLGTDTLTLSGVTSADTILFSGGTIGVGIGTGTSNNYKVDVNGDVRAKKYFLQRTDGASTTVGIEYGISEYLLFGTSGGTVNGFVFGGNQWGNSISPGASYIYNNYTEKGFVVPQWSNANTSGWKFAQNDIAWSVGNYSYEHKLLDFTATIVNATTGMNTTYGLYTKITDNAPSYANKIYGLYADVSGGTNPATLRYSGVFMGGNVGINTLMPSHSLHVSATTNPLRFEGLQSASDTNILTIDASGIVHTMAVSSIPTSGGSSGTEVFVTGGTYAAGTATFTNNTGGTFNVTGFTSGGTSTNLYNTDGTLSGNRTVNIGTNTLKFSGTSTGNTVLISGGTIGFGIGTNAGVSLSTLNNKLYVKSSTGSTNGTIVALNAEIAGMDVGIYGGSVGFQNDYSKTSRTELYFRTFNGGSTNGNINFESGSFKLVLDVSNPAQNAMKVVYGGNSASLIVGSNTSIVPSSGQELRLGSSGSDNKITLTTTGIVGINSTSPNASAQLDVASTTRGFLPPRMTTVQRDAISSPAAGLIIYNTTDSKHQGYDGATWNNFY